MAQQAVRRIRGRPLQRIRAELLADNPLCSGPDSECEKQGRVTLAREVDHVVALCNGGTESYDPYENRQRLCKACHDAKTYRDLNRNNRPYIGEDGWPIGTTRTTRATTDEQHASNNDRKPRYSHDHRGGDSLKLFASSETACRRLLSSPPVRNPKAKGG